jgi:hypothetical protein
MMPWLEPKVGYGGPAWRLLFLSPHGWPACEDRLLLAFACGCSIVNTASKLAARLASSQAVCLGPSVLFFGIEVGLACVPAAWLVAASSVSQDLGLIPVSRLTRSWLVPVSNSAYP